MTFRRLAVALAICLPALLLSAGSGRSKKRASGTVTTAKEAKSIAERDTGGQAVSARRIPLNGASGGWEVDVRMPHEDRGWRCVVDADTHMVFTRTHIENPRKKGR